MSPQNHIQPEQGCAVDDDRMIVFCIGRTQVLRITEAGMFYNGQFVKDAGEAHRAFLAMVEEMRAHQAKTDYAPDLAARPNGLNLRSLRKLVWAVQAMHQADKDCGFYNDEAWLAAYAKTAELAEEFKDL